MTKNEMPARSGNYEASTDPKDQLHSTTPNEDIQALCNAISADLYDRVGVQLSEAKVILNDQGNLFFDRSCPESDQDKELLAHSFLYASIRQDVIRDLVLDAVNGMADVLDRLESGIREGRLPE